MSVVDICPACNVKVELYTVTTENAERIIKKHFPGCKAEQCPVSWRVHIVKADLCQHFDCRAIRGEWSEEMARQAVFGDIPPCPEHSVMAALAKHDA